MKEFEFMKDQERIRLTQASTESDEIYGKKPKILNKRRIAKHVAMSTDNLPLKLRQQFAALQIPLGEKPVELKEAIEEAQKKKGYIA